MKNFGFVLSRAILVKIHEVKMSDLRCDINVSGEALKRSELRNPCPQKEKKEKLAVGNTSQKLPLE